MGLLVLLIINIVTLMFFEVSFFFLLWFFCLGLIDYFYARHVINFIKGGWRKLLTMHISKKISLVFNMLAVICSCLMLYIEYLNPKGAQLDIAFKTCSVYTEEFKEFHKYADLIPNSFKCTMVSLSGIIDTVTVYAEKSKECTIEEEKAAITEEVKSYIEEQQKVILSLEQDLRYIEYCAQLLAVLICVYKALWHWLDIKYLYTSIKNIIIKYK